MVVITTTISQIIYNGLNSVINITYFKTTNKIIDRRYVGTFLGLIIWKIFYKNRVFNYFRNCCYALKVFYILIIML